MPLDWVRAERTPPDMRLAVWELKVAGLSNNANSDKSGVTKETVSKLLAELEERPHVPYEYLTTFDASDLLKAHWKQLWGEPPPEFVYDAKDRDLFGPLSDRYWVQRVVTDLMNKAEAEGFRLDASAGYEERHKKWDDELTKVYEAYMDNEWDWEINAVEISSFLIFGARCIDDFPTKILQLFEKHDYKNIRDAHPQFLPELKELLGLPERDVTRPLMCV